VLLLGACDSVDAVDVDRQELRQLASSLDLAPLAPPPLVEAAQVNLGRALFFDPELSGNRDQSCSSCHHPDEGMGDGRSLSVGTGSVIRDGVRMPGPDHTFVPRNSPGLFNLSQAPLHNLLWDGRVEELDDGSFVLHDVGYEALGLTRVLPPGLDNLAAAQAMLPVVVRDELRGEAGELDIHDEPNELALIDDNDFEGIWGALTDRLLGIDTYVELLLEANPEVEPQDVSFVHAANAIAAFLSTDLTLKGSAWDRFLEGDDQALSPEAVRGALLFYGRAGCDRCHEGSMMSDQRFHNLGVRPMGSGPSDLEHIDYGAAHRSHVGAEFRFAFRTPPLHNVAQTGPWMHNGCYDDLAAVVRHHLDPIGNLHGFDSTQLDEEFRGQVHDNPDVLAQVEETIDSGLLIAEDLTEEEIAELVDFLESLSSPWLDELSQLAPDSVPSGLPLAPPN